MRWSRVNASDPSQFDPWFDVLRRSEEARHGRPGQGWHPDEWRVRAIDVDAPKVWHLFSYGDDVAHPVAMGALEYTRDDNQHWVRGELHVLPEHRRRGIGSAALHQLERSALELDRPTLVVSVTEGSDEVGTAPNREFAPRMGYSVADEGVRRDLDWPRPPGELDRLESEWRPFAEGYEIVTWLKETPEQFVDDRVHLSAVMPAEAPYADLDVEAESWSESRLREHERTCDAMGRDLFVSAALHRESGHLVGYSELTCSREYTDNAYQWDTLVLSAHRGHRLGGLLKIATMRLLERSQLPVKRISTFNSALNTPMIAVNEAIGARVAGANVMWRKDLTN